MEQFNGELYAEMQQDNGIQYDNNEVAEEMLSHFWD